MKTLFSLFLVCLTVQLGCSHSDSAAPAPVTSQPVVKTVTVAQTDVSEELSLTARVQPDPANVVRVYPPASGRLLRVAIRPGDRVQKGSPVAVLESSDIAQARSDYAKAESEYNKDQHALERSQLLFDHKVLSERELEDQKAATEQAKSELERAQDRLKILGAPLKGSSNEITLVAPRSGSVIDIGAAGGELSKSTDNANPICTIADLDSVWIVGDIYEKDLASIRSGEPIDITINAYPDRHWTAKLAVISDTVDPQTRTLKVRAVLPNPDHLLKPEMFATIHVRKPASQALVIPATALLHEGGDTSVMVETKPGNYERRLVTVKSSDTKQAIIASGVRPGETVVAEGAALVRGGGDSQ